MDFWNGREFLTHTDLVLPGLVGIEIQRSYDSQTKHDSALGYGWAIGYFMRLHEFADGSVIVRRDCGVRRSFVLAGGAYQTPVGETGTLIKNGDGSWTYLELSGERKEFDNQGRLAALVTRFGPRLVFSYDSGGKLPLIGLSPYAIDTTPKEIAREYRLLRIDEQDSSGSPTGRWVTFMYDTATGRLTNLNDSAGRTVTYNHADGIGNLTSVNLPENGVLTYLYQDPNDPHNATTLTDSACASCGGGEYLNVYDAQDRVIRQEHGTNIIRITYVTPYVKTSVIEEVSDDQGNLLRSGETVWEFNGLGNPLKVTDALGHQKVYVRDPQMNPTRYELWENLGTPQIPNRVLRYAEDRTYTAQGQLESLTEAVGTPDVRTTTYAYNPATNRLQTITTKSVVNPAQNKVTRFDEAGTTETLTETGLLGDGTPYTYVTATVRNSNGQVTSVDGPRTDVSDVTTYDYDGPNLATVTQPIVGPTTYTNYTAAGRPQTVTDPNGVATTYTYDSLGRMRTRTIAGHITRYGYTSTGKTDTTTLPNLNTITYVYDALDRLATIRDGLNNTINYTYDSAGQRTKEEIKDASGALQKTVSMEYDVLNRLSKVVNPDTNFTQYGYDAAGNQASVRNPRGFTTNQQYDGLNRLRQITQPGNITTLYGYNTRDNLTWLTDPNTYQTTYTYDDMGRVYREVSPDTGTTTYGYDPAGNRTSKLDARNIAIGYTYDALNRLTLVNFPTDPDITYTYDACTNGKGRLCQVVDQAGTTSYVYDPKGQLTQETKVIAGVTYLTGYGYDANGNLQSIAYPSGRVVAYTHDGADRVSLVTTTPPGGPMQTVASTIAYKPFGGVSGLIYGNGLARTVGYDLQYRITGIQTTGAQALTYVPDPNGNVGSITNALDPSRNKTFTYDPLDRLWTATGPWGTPLGWTYDGVGNRLTQSAPEGSSNYVYQPGNNRLESVTGPDPKTFGYDSNGNTTTENSRTYVYSQNNRLIQATEGAVLGDYGFDASQQRTIKTVAGQVTVFHHDPRGRILGESQGSGATVAEYIYLEGQPLLKGDGALVRFIHTDHLGTPQLMTDASGATVWDIASRPFGDGTTITGTATLNHRFPGQYDDQENGLQQNWHRDYSATLGRYLEPDPLRLNPAMNSYYYRAYHYRAGYYRRHANGAFVAESLLPSSAAMRLSSAYAYALDSPVGYIDPSGLRDQPPGPPGGWQPPSQPPPSFPPPSFPPPGPPPVIWRPPPPPPPAMPGAPAATACLAILVVWSGSCVAVEAYCASQNSLDFCTCMWASGLDPLCSNFYNYPGGPCWTWSPP